MAVGFRSFKHLHASSMFKLYPWVNEDAHIAEMNNLIKKLIRKRIWTKNLSESGYGLKTYQKPDMD